MLDKRRVRLPSLRSAHNHPLMPSMSTTAFLQSAALPHHRRSPRSAVCCNGAHSQARRLAIRAKLTRSNIPMTLTYARIAAIPLLCAINFSPAFPTQPLFQALIFALASFTDWLDGYLARKWDVVSSLGIFLDPVADKLMVAVALVLISARFPLPLIVLSTCFIISREIFVSALREWMAILGKSADVKVSSMGKLKTAMQMIAVTLLLLTTSMSLWYARLGLLLLIAAAFLSVLSASDYVRSATRALKSS